MVSTTLNLTNRAQITARLEKTIKSNPAFVDDALYALVGRFIFTMDNLIPRDTGKYASSWGVEKNGTTIQFRIDPSATFGEDARPMTDLAYWLEVSGTKRHFVAPVNASSLHWTLYQNQREFFSKGHYVRGFKAMPHIRPARIETNREKKFIVRAVAMTHFEYMPNAKQENLSVPLSQLINIGKTGKLSARPKFKPH